MSKIDLNQFKHQTKLNVRFMDFDALHHVNNARYLNYLEESRIKYCQDVLDLFTDIDKFNVLVARIEIDFMKPILFNSEVTVHTRVPKIGGKSLLFESIICSKLHDREAIVSRAVQTLVSFDPKTNESIMVPQDIRSKIQAYEINLSS